MSDKGSFLEESAPRPAVRHSWNQSQGEWGWEGSRVGADWGVGGREDLGEGRGVRCGVPRGSPRSPDQSGESGWGWGSAPPSHLSSDSVYVPLFLLQLLPFTPCLLVASLFAAPPHRLPLSTSWGPS